AFVGGLKAELGAEVRLDRPRSTRAAMEVARLHDDHLVAVRRARPSEGRTDVRRANVVVDDTPPWVEVKPTVGDGTRTTSNYRRLTEDEIQRRREKGLCFTCNEKFVPGYKCKGKEIFVLEIEEGREEEKPQEESWLHMVKCNKRGPKMIKFTAEIKDMLLEVLVDSGSSLNFIDERIAQKLKLVPTKVKRFGVKVANGHKLQGSQLFKKVPIMAQYHELEIAFYALPLKATNIVLGVQWLETLGPITTDYKRGKMELEDQESALIDALSRKVKGDLTYVVTQQSRLIQEFAQMQIQVVDALSTAITGSVSSMQVQPTLRERIRREQASDVFVRAIDAKACAGGIEGFHRGTDGASEFRGIVVPK
ncbi:Unknown protein, partial [Striga hermonthica]